MTTSPSPQKSLRKLTADLPSLAAGCASFAYFPSLFFFSGCGLLPHEDFLIGPLFLGGTVLLWLFLLTMIVRMTRHHAALRQVLAKETATGQAPVPSAAQRRQFTVSRMAACMNLFCGPVWVWAICRCCSQPAHVAGCLTVAIAVMTITWLPASIMWLRATADDDGLMRKIRIARFDHLAPGHGRQCRPDENIEDRPVRAVITGNRPPIHPVTPSRPERPPLEKLDAHLPWVTLACASFAYTPGLLFLGMISGKHLVNDYIAGRVGLVSLLIMIGTLTYHSMLRAAARAEAEERRALFPGTRPLQRFQIHRTIAFIGMACGAYLLWMIFHQDDELTRIFFSVVFAMTCLPGCVIWLWTIERDVHLVRRLVRVIP